MMYYMHGLIDLNNTPVIQANNSNNENTSDSNSIALASQRTMPVLIFTNTQFPN